MTNIMTNRILTRLENQLCNNMEECMLMLPFFVESFETMEKLYDSMLFKYFEVYPNVNFIPDITKVTLVKEEREV